MNPNDSEVSNVSLDRTDLQLNFAFLAIFCCWTETNHFVHVISPFFFNCTRIVMSSVN
jgi:hypothetical protein